MKAMYLSKLKEAIKHERELIEVLKPKLNENLEIGRLNAAYGIADAIEGCERTIKKCIGLMEMIDEEAH